MATEPLESNKDYRGFDIYEAYMLSNERLDHSPLRPKSGAQGKRLPFTLHQAPWTLKCNKTSEII